MLDLRNFMVKFQNYFWSDGAMIHLNHGFTDHVSSINVIDTYKVLSQTIYIEITHCDLTH